MEIAIRHSLVLAESNVCSVSVVGCGTGGRGGVRCKAGVRERDVGARRHIAAI